MSTLAAGAAASVITAAGSVLDGLFTSDEERLKVGLALEELRQQPALLELERQKTEAAHASWFVAGARPAVLWVGCAGLAYAFVVQPLLAWATAVVAGLLGWAGGLFGSPPLDPASLAALMPPVLDMAALTACLTGTGALAALRSYEKTQGVARASLYEEARPPAHAVAPSMADLERMRDAQLALASPARVAVSHPVPARHSARAAADLAAPIPTPIPAPIPTEIAPLPAAFEAGAEGRV